MKNQQYQINPGAACKPAARLIQNVTMATALLGLCLTLTGRAGNGPLPPGSSAFGKNLAQWQALWLDWDVGDVTLETDTYGNARSGPVVLLSVPNTPGDGTPGSLNLTLGVGERFVLPLMLLYGNSYDNGTPNDALVSPSDFQNGTLKLTLDGATIMDNTTAFQFYTSTVYNPPLPFDFPPFTTIIWVQGISMVHTPLLPGQHTMTLDEKFTFPEYSVTFEYHNTWHLTVAPTATDDQ
jgi:hypothetical protein